MLAGDVGAVVSSGVASSAAASGSASSDVVLLESSKPDALTHNGHHEASRLAQASVNSMTVARAIVFVDQRVDDFASLNRSISDDAEVVLLDDRTDGLSQISNHLKCRTGVQSLHVVAHGEKGRLHIGRTVVDQSTLLDRAAQVQQWSDSLTDDADILIYACNLASGSLGREFVGKLATLTGADIAASDDLTGSRNDADWDLEHQIGSIETSVVFAGSARERWQSVLELPVDSINSSKAISTKETVVDELKQEPLDDPKEQLKEPEIDEEAGAEALLVEAQSPLVEPIELLPPEIVQPEAKKPIRPNDEGVLAKVLAGEPIEALNEIELTPVSGSVDPIKFEVTTGPSANAAISDALDTLGLNEPTGNLADDALNPLLDDGIAGISKESLDAESSESDIPAIEPEAVGPKPVAASVLKVDMSAITLPIANSQNDDGPSGSTSKLAIKTVEVLNVKTRTTPVILTPLIPVTTLAESDPIVSDSKRIVSVTTPNMTSQVEVKLVAVESKPSQPTGDKVEVAEAVATSAPTADVSLADRSISLFAEIQVIGHDSISRATPSQDYDSGQASRVVWAHSETFDRAAPLVHIEGNSQQSSGQQDSIKSANEPLVTNTPDSQYGFEAAQQDLAAISLGGNQVEASETEEIVGAALHLDASIMNVNSSDKSAPSQLVGADRLPPDSDNEIPLGDEQVFENTLSSSLYWLEAAVTPSELILQSDDVKESVEHIDYLNPLSRYLDRS